MPDRLYQHETTEAGGQVQHKRKRLPGYPMGGQLFLYYPLGCPFILSSHHGLLWWNYCIMDANTQFVRWYLALQPLRFNHFIVSQMPHPTIYHFSLNYLFQSSVKIPASK